MNIRHHFDEATLVAYAAGNLPDSLSLLVACHLHWCPHCKERVQQAESIGGVLLDNIEPSPLDMRFRNQVLSQLDQKDTELNPMDSDTIEHSDSAASATQKDSTDIAWIPQPLKPLLTVDEAQLPWRKLVQGIDQIEIYQSSNKSICRLLRIAPGVAVPHHSHQGHELTLVLKGSYSDEIGRFCAGDVADLDHSIYHQPIVDTDESCICLIATDAPLRFSGLMQRLVQPWIGI